MGTIAGAADTANIELFAEQTIAMMSAPNSVFTADESILIKRYLVASNPVFSRSVELADEGIEVSEALSSYTLFLATLTTRGSDEEQVAGYVAGFERFRNELVGRTDITAADFDQIMAEAKTKETLLLALRAAQPVINAIGGYGQALLDDYDKNIVELASSSTRRPTSSSTACTWDWQEVLPKHGLSSSCGSVPTSEWPRAWSGRPSGLRSRSWGFTRSRPLAT